MSLQEYYTEITKHISNIHYPKAIDIAKLASTDELRKYIAAQWLSEGIPFIFMDKPFVFEYIREKISNALTVEVKDIYIQGSAKLGTSLSPHKLNSPFHGKSDLDFFIVSENLFNQIYSDFCRLVEDYDEHLQNGGQKITKIERDRKYIEEKANNNGFIQSDYIKTFFNKQMSDGSVKQQQYKTVTKIRKLLNNIDLSLKVLPSTSELKPSSIRCYRNWNSFFLQANINLKEVNKMSEFNDISDISYEHFYVYNLTNEELICSKGDDIIKSIASITKIITAMVLLDNVNDLESYIKIEDEDKDIIKYTHSKFATGDLVTKSDLLISMMISSDNVAAMALARTTFSDGVDAFINAMNMKVEALGLKSTKFVEPTGLDYRNVSTCKEIFIIIRELMSNYSLICNISLKKKYSVVISGSKNTKEFYNNSYFTTLQDNFLHIIFSKTGFINESGRCLTLSGEVNRKHFILIALNSSKDSEEIKYDIKYIKKWMIEKLK